MIFYNFNRISSRLYKGAFRYIQHKTEGSQEINNHVLHLRKHLNISDSEAQYLCMKQPVITKLNEERIKSLVDFLKEVGFSGDVLIKEPAFFGVLPITLKLRHKVLKECGIQIITPTILATYLTLIRKSTIEELKQSKVIPSHINIENYLASHMTQWPTSLTTLVYEDVNNTTLYTLRLKIIQRYLELVLDLTNEEFCRGIKTYATIRHRPLSYINETLAILQSDVMIPNYKIKSNLYLIHADPENLRNIIYNFKHIGGIDIREVIRLHPKIALRNFEMLIEMRRLLESYGISNEAQRRCFDLYTLSPNTVKDRLEKAKDMPEFKMYFNHPRFLKMIYYNKTALKRLRDLYENNKKCLSLNILSGSSAHYKAFEKTSGDKLGKVKDLIFCISQSLGKDFKKSQIREIVQRHPFWVHTPLIQVKHVHEELSKQFTNHDICENCTILLYPWNKIRETLNVLKNRRLQEQLTIFHENFDFSALSNTQKLSLVLYIIEKNHYFSGNGVWLDEKFRNVEKV